MTQFLTFPNFRIIPCKAVGIWKILYGTLEVTQNRTLQLSNDIVSNLNIFHLIELLGF